MTVIQENTSLQSEEWPLEKVIEECSEVILAYMHSRTKRHSRDNIFEEIADLSLAIDILKEKLSQVCSTDLLVIEAQRIRKLEQIKEAINRGMTTFNTKEELLYMISQSTNIDELKGYVRSCYDIDVVRNAANRIFDLENKERKKA